MYFYIFCSRKIKYCFCIVWMFFTVNKNLKIKKPLLFCYLNF